MTSSGKVRIYELSRDLGLDNRDVLDAAEKLSIAAKSHSSSISDDEASRIRDLIRPNGSRGTRSTAPARPGPPIMTEPAKAILSLQKAAAPAPPATPATAPAVTAPAPPLAKPQAAPIAAKPLPSPPVVVKPVVVKPVVVKPAPPVVVKTATTAPTKPAPTKPAPAPARPTVPPRPVAAPVYAAPSKPGPAPVASTPRPAPAQPVVIKASAAAPTRKPEAPVTPSPRPATSPRPVPRGSTPPPRPAPPLRPGSPIRSVGAAAGNDGQPQLVGRPQSGQPGGTSSRPAPPRAVRPWASGPAAHPSAPPRQGFGRFRCAARSNWSASRSVAMPPVPPPRSEQESAHRCGWGECPRACASPWPRAS